MRLIYGLKGEIYYIEQKKEECYYLKQLMQTDREVKAAVLESYGYVSGERQELRRFMEDALSAIAQELKLPKDWSYDDLYIAMLEGTARRLRISRYRIYTVEELLLAVKEKDRKTDGTITFQAYSWLILNRIAVWED